MKILAIDTSCKTAMAVLSENGNVISAIQLHDNKTHSVKLLPAVEYILDAAGVEPAQVEAVAVTNGPGSYTGLRIGVTTAKTFAYTLKIPLVGINTLEVLAAPWNFDDCGAKEAEDEDTVVCPMIDARNARVYTSIYKTGKIISETQAMECTELCDKLLQLDCKKIVFTGDGSLANRELLLERLGDKCVFVHTEMACGNPTALAYVAAKEISVAAESGKLVECTAEGLKVNYYKNYTDSI